MTRGRLDAGLVRRERWQMRTGCLLAGAMLVACGRQTGEGWAKDTLGQEGAEKLRGEVAARVPTSLRETPGAPIVAPPPSGAPKAAYLPRPYVVFDIDSDRDDPMERKIVYSALNKSLGQSMTSAAGVKALVVQHYIYKTEGTGKRKKGYAEFDLEIIDREKSSSVHAHANRGEDVKSVLEALPQSP